MEMTTLLNQFIIIVIIAIISIGASILWRTSIYTRGSIFRPVGRLLDLWVYKACLPGTSFGRKILRFIAYPLGKCIYCSSFHIAYDTFFILNWKFNLQLQSAWLLVLLPLTHIFIVIMMKIVNSNYDLHKDDWHYMSSKENEYKIIDVSKKSNLKSPLTEEDEDRLEKCKSGNQTES